MLRAPFSTQMLSLVSLHPPLCCRVNEEATKIHTACGCSGFLLIRLSLNSAVRIICQRLVVEVSRVSEESKRV